MKTARFRELPIWRRERISFRGAVDTSTYRADSAAALPHLSHSKTHPPRATPPAFLRGTPLRLNVPRRRRVVIAAQLAQEVSSFLHGSNQEDSQTSKQRVFLSVSSLELARYAPMIAHSLTVSPAIHAQKRVACDLTRDMRTGTTAL